MFPEFGNSLGEPKLLLAPLAVSFLLAIPTNTYFLWLMVTGAGRTVASECFALDMTVSEIINSLFTVLAIIAHFMHAPVIVVYIYQLWGCLMSFGHSLFQLCICMERYLAVVHPVTFMRYRPLRYKVMCSGLADGSCSANVFMTSWIYCWFVLTEVLVVFSINLFLGSRNPGETLAGEREKGQRGGRIT